MKTFDVIIERGVTRQTVEVKADSFEIIKGDVIFFRVEDDKSSRYCAFAQGTWRSVMEKTP